MTTRKVPEHDITPKPQIGKMNQLEAFSNKLDGLINYALNSKIPLDIVIGRIEVTKIKLCNMIPDIKVTKLGQN